MAYHIINDDKGRPEKILNEEEYQEYKSRKIGYVLLAICVAFTIIASLFPDSKKKRQTKAKTKTEVVSTNQQTLESTTIEQPTFVYEAVEDTITSDYNDSSNVANKADSMSIE